MNEESLLLIENDVGAISSALTAFEETRFPYKVVVARDSREAMDFLYARGAYAGRDARIAPLMILMDAERPRSADVLRRLRADPLLRHVVVLLLSSSAEPSGARETGARLYLRKPESPEAFVGLAKKVRHMLSALKRPQPVRLR